MYNLVSLVYVCKMWNRHCTQDNEHAYHPPQFTFVVFCNTALILLFLCLQTITSLLSVHILIWIFWNDVLMKSCNMCSIFLWLVSLRVIICGIYPCYCVSVIHSFYCWIVFCCMDISLFVCPFICWWTFGHFPYLAIANKMLCLFIYN